MLDVTCGTNNLIDVMVNKIGSHLSNADISQLFI